MARPVPLVAILLTAMLTAAGTTTMFLAGWSRSQSPVERRIVSLPAIDRPLSVGQIAETLAKSVVAIQTGASTSSGNLAAAGTGFVIDDSGLIATNAHVIEGAQVVAILLPDGTERSARVVSRAENTDVAFVRVSNFEGLTPAKLGDSQRLQVGDDVVAIGNALDLGAAPTVTQGIVSATARSIVESETGLKVDNLVQTDAAINRGNSGGPLVNSLGEVVGINTAVAGNAQNIGFAIAINEVKALIDEARTAKAPAAGDGFLGVSTTRQEDIAADDRERLKIPTDAGAVVANVIPSSPAAIAKIKVGNVITSFDGQPVTSPEDLSRLARDARAGSTHTLTVVSDEGAREASVTLTDRS